MFWLENHREDDGNFGNAGGGIDWNSIINQSFAVGSQAIGAWGRNPTTQVATNQSQGIFAIQSNPNQTNQQQTYNPYAGMTPAQIQAMYKTTNGGAAEDAFGSLTEFISKHPLIVFGGIAAAFLLFREPPKRRN